MKQKTKVQSPAVDQTKIQPKQALATTAATPRTARLGWLDLSPRAGAILFVVTACLVCLGYTFYTNQIWEDSLITLRHSENLLKGEALTYNVGERVHGFTSPINVLLLTVCSWLTGQSSYVATFWLYRLFTIPAFAAGGVLLLKAFHETPPRWSAATGFLGVVYLSDVKNVAFSTNGMETAFMLLFVAWAVYLMSRSQTDQWLLRGLCWGGMMWTRPDGWVYVAALSLAELTFLSTSRRSTLISLAKSAAICIAVYGPWLVWTWWYYGSPIPNTIIAKANIEQGPLTQLLATMDNFLTGLISMAAQAFRPIYYGEQIGWAGFDALGRLISGLTKVVGVVALVYFLCPVQDRFGRAMSLCFAVLCSYFTYMPIAYPWYFPPAMIVGLIAFTRAAVTFTAQESEHVSEYRRLQRRRTFILTSFVFLALGAILVFLLGCREERIQQAEIEMGNRAAIGTWLKENGKPTDTVFLEPFGYIGYFSGMHINDFPGLVSPEVVRLRRKLPASELSFQASKYLILPELKPDWVVFRIREYRTLANFPAFKTFQEEYTLGREFNVDDQLLKYDLLPGRNTLQYDADFGVFRRNQPAASAPGN